MFTQVIINNNNIHLCWYMWQRNKSHLSDSKHDGSSEHEPHNCMYKLYLPRLVLVRYEMWRVISDCFIFSPYITVFIQLKRTDSRRNMFQAKSREKGCANKPYSFIFLLAVAKNKVSQIEKCIVRIQRNPICFFNNFNSFQLAPLFKIKMII